MYIKNKYLPRRYQKPFEYRVPRIKLLIFIENTTLEKNHDEKQIFHPKGHMYNEKRFCFKKKNNQNAKLKLLVG